MDFKRITAAALAAALICCSAGCGKKKTVTAEEIKGTAVETMTVSASDLRSEATVNGMVAAKTAVPVVPMASGKINTLKVAEGDMVEKGQLLMQIDTSAVTGSYDALASSYASSKAAIDAGIAAAEEQLSLAKTNYDNAVALFDVGAASQLEVDSAKTQYDAARLQIEQARSQGNASLSSIKAQMDQIGTQAGLGKVTAPCSGKVISLSVVEGGVAGQSAAMVIAEGGEMRISASISENLLASVKPGDKAEVNIAAIGIEPIEATVETVSGMINQQTGMYDIELVPAVELDCPIGVFATVTFVTEHRENVITVPTEAILNDDAGTYVYTLEGTNAHKTPIETGMIGDDQTEVTSGLKGGETLVTRGQSYLTEGSLVRIVGGN